MSRFRWIFVFAIVLAMFLLAAFLFGAKSDLEIQRGEIEVAWIKVDQDLERRASCSARLVGMLEDSRRKQQIAPLVPRLSSLSVALHEMHAATSVADRIAAHTRLEMKLQLLRNAAEGKPELKHDPDLQRLLDETLAIENRIHQDRTEYNEAVQRYNVSLALFPANLAAIVFRLHRHEVYLPTELHGSPMPPSPAISNLP